MKEWHCRVCGRHFNAEEEPLQCPKCEEDRPMVLHCGPCARANDPENSSRLQVLILGKATLRVICRRHGLVSAFHVAVMDPSGGVVVAPDPEGGEG